jgi:hypothetical protein
MEPSMQTLKHVVTALRDFYLKEQLGVYVHDTNKALNIPAISTGTRIPPHYSIKEGLEVVVQTTPEDRHFPLLGDGLDIFRIWVITLKQWSSGVGLSESIQTLRANFKQMPDPVILGETDTTIEQAIVRLPIPRHEPDVLESEP